MQLAAHELNELSELVAGCFNTVTCMSSYMNQAQDPELKQLLQKHFPLHVKDYNLKVEFLQSQSVPNIEKFQPDTLNPQLSNYTQSQPLPAGAPRTNVQQHTDREIALAYLINQKGSAKNYAVAATECANPNLRTFLENAFLNSSHHAYEMFEYMAKKGYYPLMAAPQTAIDTMSTIYQPVPMDGGQPQMPMQ
ncbi:spore coat protein [Bacillus fonticola]|uniref:spore coat protein n=1 Tax=Bacillus fonticola TaxID=2728853 RepID=UPI001472FA80|nr:spore coat protein [Bacillus fonticola]